MTPQAARVTLASAIRAYVVDIEAQRAVAGVVDLFGVDGPACVRPWDKDLDRWARDRGEQQRRR